MTIFIEITVIKDSEGGTMYILQTQLENLKKNVRPGRVVILYGPRRVGKTTLLKQYLSSSSNRALYVNGDDIVARRHLENHLGKRGMMRSLNCSMQRRSTRLERTIPGWSNG